METSVTEQRQLRAALDAALATTFDFGIRKLRAPRWQPAPDSEASAELASVQVRQDGQPWSDDVLRTPYAAASLLMTGVLVSLTRFGGHPPSGVLPRGRMSDHGEHGEEAPAAQSVHC